MQADDTCNEEQPHERDTSKRDHLDRAGKKSTQEKNKQTVPNTQSTHDHKRRQCALKQV